MAHSAAINDSKDNKNRQYRFSSAEFDNKAIIASLAQLIPTLICPRYSHAVKNKRNE